MEERIVRINMETKTVSTEPCPMRWKRLGGRGLIAKVLNEEVPPACHPLGNLNKLIVAPGLLTGTGAPNFGKLSIGGKSPLTSGAKESNVGGTVGQKISALGIKALIVEGRPKQKGLWYILVNDRGVEILEASDLAGKGCYETTKRLLEKHPGAGVLTIGPAGEMLASAACISATDIDGCPSRQAGRGGMGALMGSKGIKAIVVESASGVGKRPGSSSFKRAVEKMTEALLSDPTTNEILPKYGTLNILSVINEVGGLPIRNFSVGSSKEAESIYAPVMLDNIVKRGGKPTHPCMPGCVIRCSNVYPGPKGEDLTAGFEYESISQLGANCGIFDLDKIAYLNRLCDDYGLDTIETGDAIAVAMEAGLLPFGDAEGAANLLHEVANQSALGRIIANGVIFTGKAFGVTRIPAVKGQGIPAYDPRALKGTGVTYLTSPMGADHTAGNCLPGVGGLDTLKPEGQVALSKKLQVSVAVYDTVGMCTFAGGAVGERCEVIAELLSGYLDEHVSPEDVLAMGRDVIKMEIEFNRKSGLMVPQTRYLEFFTTEPLPPKDTVFDVPYHEIDQIFDA